MPVPVIPVCAVSCCLPRPICEIKQPECFVLFDPSQPCDPPPPLDCFVICSPSEGFCPPDPPQACDPPQSAIENAPLEAPIQTNNNQIPTYCPGLPDPPPGTFLTTSSFVIPPGYLLLNGLEVSRTTYSSLFQAIGTYYGDGDGSTTFNLPNISCDNSSGFVLFYIIKT
jgi:hypothetical protein